MTRLVFDIETDGFVDSMTRIHSLVFKDVDTGQVWSCHDQHKLVPISPDHVRGTGFSVAGGLMILQKADEIIGHNIIKFDIPAIQKIYPWFKPQGKITDTLVMTRLIWTDIKAGDSKRFKAGQLPGKLIGSHSLEAWGYRLRRWKGDYSQMMKDQGLDPWAEWNQEMQDYCVQDVEVNTALLAKIDAKNYSQAAMELETQTAQVCAQIERNGFHFSVTKGVKLYGTLSARRAELELELTETFKGWWASLGEFVPKRTLNFKDVMRQSYKEGVVYTKIKWVDFNPASRDHIANRLTTLYGWVPQEFTKDGKPKLDDEVLSELPYPTAPLLTEYFLLQKRIGQLAEGNQAWLKVERDGFIFGSINPNGAVTGRATHSWPNVAQVPKVGSLFGQECREMFDVPEGWFLCGTDISGLELRCLGHFMAKWDGGAYANAVIEGRSSDGTDVHSLTAKALGLDPKAIYTFNGKTATGRDFAKTFIYAFLYGAGDYKLGSIVGQGMARGKQLRANFMASFPALANLIKAVKLKAKQEGFLLGLDKRHIRVRSAHASLNSLLQCAGALVCKKWMVLLEQRLLSLGYSHRWDGDFAFCAWVHDELQIAVKTEELANEIGRLSAECAAEAGEFFGFRCPQTSDFKAGYNWADTH